MARKADAASKANSRPRLTSSLLGVIGLAVGAPGLACAQSEGRAVEISRNADRVSTRGPAENFTGSVRVETYFEPHAPARTSAALVTFEPGARTAWHRHPLGQRLIVVSGVGRTQVEGGQIEEFGAGDVIWCPPDLPHWHGASPVTAMSHIAIQESLNGSPVIWMQQVTDEEYAGD